MEPVLISGEWRQAKHTGSFRAVNPATTDFLARDYPISSWADCEAALAAAESASASWRMQDPAKLADFLEEYARRLEDEAVAICEQAQLETALRDQATSAGSRNAANHAPAAFGSGCGPRRIVAVGHDRHGEQSPLLLWTARTGRRLRT